MSAVDIITEISPEAHCFTPQNQIVVAVNDIFGFRDLSEVPSYYQPDEEGIRVANALVNLALRPDSDVLFIFDGKTFTSETQPADDKYIGLRTIVGPADLGELVGDDTTEPDSQLWDKGLWQNSFYLDTEVNL